MKVSYKKVLSIIYELTTIAIIFVVSLIFSGSNKETQIRVVAISSILVLLQSLVIVWKVNRRFNIYSILILMTGIFMFGQHILFLLNIAPEGMILLQNKVSQDAIYKTGFLILYSILVMNIGYIISCFTIEQEHEHELTEKKEYERCSIYNAGLIFFSISFTPTIIVLSKNIMLTFTVGYGERMLNSSYQTSGIENISGILGSFMVPSLIALFIGRKPRQKFPIIAIAAYMILYTMSGSRINTVILLVGTLYVQNILFSNLNFKKLLRYGVYAIVILLVLSAVSVARTSVGSANSNSNMVFKDSIEQVIENNVVVSAVSEAGYTFSATAVVVDRCPSDVEYKYGMSYVRAIAYLLPNGMTGNLYAKIGSADNIFKGYLNQYGSGIGSSYIAEAYCNFGYASLIIIFIFGLLLGKLSRELDLAILNRDYVRIFILTYIFITVSFYVRSETSTFFRNIVWFGLPVVFVANQIKGKRQTMNAMNQVGHCRTEEQ